MAQAETRPAPTEAEARKTHATPLVARPADLNPDYGRFRNLNQMVFHPSADDPTRPNAGVITYQAGTGFPLHKHDFAQIWYMLEGECQFGPHRLTPGDMVYLPDPHYEHEMHTEAGCKILFVQYPGPTTGARPIFQGRFDLDKAPPLAEADLET